MVRPRRVRAARDDRRERDVLRAEIPERELDPPGQLGLGAPDDGLDREASVEQVARMGGRTDCVELRGVLDRTEPFDCTFRRDELDPAAGKLRMGRNRDRGRLEADPSAGELGQPPAEIGRRLVGRLDDVHLRRASRGLQVATVGEQHRAVGVDEQLRVRALETTQVANVRPVGDEERVDLERSEEPAQPVQPGAHSAAASQMRASRYPSGPCPTTRCETTSSITECRRHSSRSAMLDRWTSTTGTASSSTASRIA